MNVNMTVETAKKLYRPQITLMKEFEKLYNDALKRFPKHEPKDVLKEFDKNRIEIDLKSFRWRFID